MKSNEEIYCYVQKLHWCHLFWHTLYC